MELSTHSQKHLLFSFFTSYVFSTKNNQDRRQFKDHLNNFILPVTAAIFGKVVSSLVSFPISSAATIAQSSDSSWRHIVKGGFTGLSAGFAPLMGFEITYSMIWWACYHNSFLMLKKGNYFGKSDETCLYISGTISTLFASSLAHPFELTRVIKVIFPEENKKH